MKKPILAAASLLAVTIFIPPWLLGFSIFHLGHAVEVATSLSAKLACSSRYVSKFEPNQIAADLSTYSPVTDLVELNYSDAPKKVTASLYGLAKVTAEYREGVGCALRANNNTPLPTINRPTTRFDNNATWPAGTMAPDISAPIQQLTQSILKQDNANGLNTRAIVVIKDGKLIAESYGRGVTHSTPLLGWSMAKSISAMFVGAMNKMNLLQLKQSGLFPEWQNDDRANIQLDHLLTMTSGLDFDETYAPGSDATHMLFTAHNASDVALQSQSLDKLGQQFFYSSGTTNLLTRLIHQTLGKSASADQLFLSQKLYNPAGIRTAVFETDTSGILVGSSYLYASARDWARFALIMLQNGRINNTQVLSSKWVKKAIQPNSSVNEKAYGYQFWLNRGDATLRWPELPEDAYAMLGNRKQSVMIIPSENIIFVRLGWTGGDYPMAENYRRLLDATLLKKTGA